MCFITADIFLYLISVEPFISFSFQRSHQEKALQCTSIFDCTYHITCCIIIYFCNLFYRCLVCSMFYSFIKPLLFFLSFFFSFFFFCMLTQFLLQLQHSQLTPSNRHHSLFLHSSLWVAGTMRFPHTQKNLTDKINQCILQRKLIPVTIRCYKEVIWLLFLIKCS